MYLVGLVRTLYFEGYTMYIKDRKKKRITRINIKWDQVDPAACVGVATVDVWHRGNNLLDPPVESGKCIVYAAKYTDGISKRLDSEIPKMTLEETRLLKCMTKSFFSGLTNAIDIVDTEHADTCLWVGIDDE